MKPSLVPTVLCTLVLVAIAASTAEARPRQDRAFLTKAMKGDNSEVMLGQLAQQRGMSQGIRDFGGMLVTDHSHARDQASQLAGSMGVSAPTDPMAQAARERRKLERLSGPAFDHEFARYMVVDHTKDIADFRREADGHGPVADLARNTLPDLHKHLNLARSLLNGGR